MKFVCCPLRVIRRTPTPASAFLRHRRRQSLRDASGGYPLLGAQDPVRVLGDLKLAVEGRHDVGALAAGIGVGCGEEWPGTTASIGVYSCVRRGVAVSGWVPDLVQ